eukprot:PhM_4_TR18318/c0_g1_i1/m.9992
MPTISINIKSHLSPSTKATTKTRTAAPSSTPPQGKSSQADIDAQAFRVAAYALNVAPCEVERRGVFLEFDVLGDVVSFLFDSEPVCNCVSQKCALQNGPLRSSKFGRERCCCYCSDKRAHSEDGLYAGYVDGAGISKCLKRWSHYCPACRSAGSPHAFITGAQQL